MEDNSLTGSFLLEPGMIGGLWHPPRPVCSAVRCTPPKQTHIPEHVYMCVEYVCVCLYCMTACLSVKVHSCARACEWPAPSCEASKWRPALSSLSCFRTVISEVPPRRSSARHSENWESKAKKKKEIRSTHASVFTLSLSLSVIFSLAHSILLSLLLSKVFPVAAPKSNCSKLCQPDRHFDIFPRLQKSTTTIGLWLRGTAEVAKAILVITSLCLYVRWHGSQTFTAGWRRRVWFGFFLFFFSGGSRLVSGFSGGLFDAPGYFFGVRPTFSNIGPGKYQGVCGVNAQNGGVSPVC